MNKRGRTPNVTIKGEVLNKHIMAIEKGGFNAAKISTFIMGKGKMYLTQSIKNNTMARASLDKLCDYYDLNSDDYVVTEEVEKQIIQEKADTQNYDNVILLLTSIDKSLREILTQIKSNNINMGYIRNDINSVGGVSKAILEKINKQ